MGLRLVRRHFEFKETAVTIVCEERFLDIARRSIFRSRETIERFILFDPLFKDTLEPYEEPRDSDPMVRRMCAAARAANVGPMAAVAGAIAEEAVKAMVEAGAEQAIVDNGGDIAMFLSETTNIALYAGQSSIKDVGFRLSGERRVYGVCTSSGTVGPSISFGVADAAVVFAPDVSLADACATRLGNEVRNGDEAVMRHALHVVCGIEGVDGALVVVDDQMAMGGHVPELVKVKTGPDRISKKYF
jgi:hypothetical protein